MMNQSLVVQVMVVMAALCSLQSLVVGASGTGWGYSKESGHGPDHWEKEYPDCNGVMQSPIDIDTSIVLYDPDLHYFDTTEYATTVGVQMSLHNVGGHTAEVKFEGTPIYLKGGNLPDTYQVDQFHFHWGKVNSRGSEHSVDTNHYPMEMHIVHHQVHLGSMTDAVDHPYGLAVFGFFFKVGAHNANFEPLLSHFDDITMPGSETEIPTFKLSDLIGGTGNLDYYRYMGSLTTPPCYESVIWSLAVEPIEISEEQLNVFRSLYDDSTNALVDDFRPIQERHSRTVITTLDDGTGRGCSRQASENAVLGRKGDF